MFLFIQVVREGGGKNAGSSSSPAVIEACLYRSGKGKMSVELRPKGKDVKTQTFSCNISVGEKKTATR